MLHSAPFTLGSVCRARPHALVLPRARCRHAPCVAHVSARTRAGSCGTVLGRRACQAPCGSSRATASTGRGPRGQGPGHRCGQRHLRVCPEVRQPDRLRVCGLRYELLVPPRVGV
eukprot:scaffold20693_cov76-Phaeocystis_antarctica.AAC.3